jgi:uncharacterized protein
MKVSLSEIPPGGIRKIVVDTGWSSGSGQVFAGRPEAEILLKLVDEDTAALQGHLQATVTANCGRCGEALDFAIDESFKYTFKAGEESVSLPDEFECSAEDCETVYIDEENIDINDVLAEQLILSLPEKLLCSEQCKGLCPQCGASLNLEMCNCVEDRSDSPFAVLKQLKK